MHRTYSGTAGPAAPVDLRSTTVTDTTVTLSWTAASDNVGVTAYRIYRDGVLIFTSSGLLFSDSGLQPATTYLYAVTALDASGNESGSSEISVTTTAAPVVVPPTSSGGGGSAGIWLLLLCLAFVMNNNPFHLFRPGTKDASISTAVFGGVHGVVRESQ